MDGWIKMGGWVNKDGMKRRKAWEAIKGRKEGKIV